MVHYHTLIIIAIIVALFTLLEKMVKIFLYSQFLQKLSFWVHADMVEVRTFCKYIIALLALVPLFLLVSFLLRRLGFIQREHGRAEFPFLLKRNVGNYCVIFLSRFFVQNSQRASVVNSRESIACCWIGCRVRVYGATSKLWWNSISMYH